MSIVAFFVNYKAEKFLTYGGYPGNENDIQLHGGESSQRNDIER